MNNITLTNKKKIFNRHTFENRRKKALSEEIMVSCDVICGKDEKMVWRALPHSYCVYAMCEQFFTIGVPSDKPNYTFFDNYLSRGKIFLSNWFLVLSHRYAFIKCNKYIPECIIKFNYLNFAETYGLSLNILSRQFKII